MRTVFSCIAIGRSYAEMEGLNNRKYCPNFMMSLKKFAAPLDGKTKLLLKRVGIIRKRSRARGSKAGKNRLHKITIVEGHRPIPKQMRKRQSVLSEIRCVKPEREQPRMPKLTLCNARSLINKTDEYELWLKSLDADIGCVTETWAHKNIPDESLSFKDYQLFRRDRNKKAAAKKPAVSESTKQAKKPATSQKVAKSTRPRSA